MLQHCQDFSSYLGHGVSTVKGVEVVHRSQAGAAGVRTDVEHMEVVAQLACSQQQVASPVEAHGRHGLVGVGVEVSHQSISVVVVRDLELSA